MVCELCKRQTTLTRHHLIPRKLHRRKHFQKRYTRNELGAAIRVCRPCHDGLHKLYDEITLGKELNSLKKLRNDVSVMKHVGWVARQRVVMNTGDR